MSPINSYTDTSKFLAIWLIIIAYLFHYRFQKNFMTVMCKDYSK